MLKNSINLDSIIFEIPTYINQHQHTGLDSTTCGSLAVRHSSEICRSFPAIQQSLDNLPSQSLTWNSSILYNNNNSLYSILPSSFSPQHNDDTSQDPIRPLSPIEDLEISDLWSNEVSTNTIETDLPVIEQENSISMNRSDMFGWNTLTLDNLSNSPIIDQENSARNNDINYHCLLGTLPKSDPISWESLFNNTLYYSAATPEEVFNANHHEISNFINPLDNLSW